MEFYLPTSFTDTRILMLAFETDVLQTGQENQSVLYHIVSKLSVCSVLVLNPVPTWRLLVGENSLICLYHSIVCLVKIMWFTTIHVLSYRVDKFKFPFTLLWCWLIIYSMHKLLFWWSHSMLICCWILTDCHVPSRSLHLLFIFLTLEWFLRITLSSYPNNKKY